ncbi:hypothetical protein HMPREF1092_01203 [Clostridium thermobutyricum]|uniref:Uncharacterized protein n=1 Tax=Clostridium thermobutyricum TaxID=29372 RepID=N9XQH3_9CLOT|nr:hypothetical protein [Clostridium thermobutyricum]ENZ01968.1 hypothetical protein HMPREF1092_01203 [Clostridium thermobutyricum]
MENKKNGNVLVESLIAISITIIALSLVGKSILNYYSIQRAEEKRYKKANIIEILEKEIKYNTSLCSINNKFKYSNEFYLDLKELDENKIINSNIIDLLNEESGDISLKKIKSNDVSIEFLIKLEEEKFEKNFEKEKWMELQGICSSGN